MWPMHPLVNAMYEFVYVRPQTLDEAVAALTEHEEATLLAGGMTLVPTMKQRLARPSHLVDVSNLLSRGIHTTDGVIHVGAGARHADIAGNSDISGTIPALACLASDIGDPMVRNRGTIGGSIANNDPAADYPAALVALAANIVTTNRVITAADFFVDMFETALEHGEIVTEIRLPEPQCAGYGKFPNPASGYAMSGAFVAQTGTGVRVAVVGAGPNVFRLPEFEAALCRQFVPEALSGLLVDHHALLSDIHADGEYRAALTSAMVGDAVRFASGPL